MRPASPEQLAGAAPFLARYEGFGRRLPGQHAARELAADVLRRDGLPGVRQEAWKYTSLVKLAEASFHEALTEASGFAGQPALPDLTALGAAHRAVFVDGRLRADLSDISALAGFRAFAETGQCGSLARPEQEQLVALNTMLAEDGAVIDIAAGEDAGLLALVSLGGDLHGTPVAFHPRHVLRLGAGARLVVAEIAVGHGVYLHNPVLEISLGQDAELVHVRLQDEAPGAFHLATIYADIGAGAAYDGFTLTIGARLARTEIHARLGGAGGRATVNAAQILRGAQHGDFTTVVTHAAPGCASRQTVKNVLDGRARGVFQGKIEVARAAQKTDGYQMNQTLLLSPDAEIDSKPQLEIFADDVKCSHGATVGELDADQLFYLRSRGIDETEARAMLVQAFLAESLDMVPHAGARALLTQAARRWWASEAA